MAELPSGTVTFLFTDLEGSTRRWEEFPDAMPAALGRHDELIRAAIEGHGGHVVKTTGDGFLAAFATAHEGVTAATSAQEALAQQDWGEVGSLRVRMGIHTGAATSRDGDYFGPALNRAARLMAVAHGGQVVCSQSTADLARDALPGAAALVDLGEHRLRDLSRPERVFQVNTAGSMSGFGPLLSLDAFPGNLPLQVSSFVGRDLEVQRIADALEESRVVTLIGVGGVGKTRLALQVAGEVLPRFPDGAWLCELASVRDPDRVVDAAAGVLRVSARPESSLEESLVAYLRDQELLLILDNCEHVLRAVARLVVAIEATCAGVRVLATSREGLNIRGEQLLIVPSLGLPDDDAGIEEAADCEAVRLFAERARAVKADFTVDAGNRADVVAVCTRLDGVALAIELAAARIPAMNPAELARRLDRRFRLLSGGDRVAIERHQTLRAAIDWSYELLTEPEQRLLARLAVFTGGCTLDAVEAVCAGDPIEADEVLELLANLVARSLVVADAGTDTRYRLLETIRQYAEERLAQADETDTLRLRHAEHYAAFASEVQRNIFGPQQIEWGARLAREHDNLLAAMDAALARHDVDLAFGLFCQLPGFGVQVNDAIVFDPEPLLELPDAAEHPGSAVALMAAGVHAWNRGNARLALELCDQSLAAQERLGPTPGSWLALEASFLRGSIAQAAGATADAAEYFLDNAGRAVDEEIPWRAALALASAAHVLSYTNPTAALRHGTEGLALARQTGMPTAIVGNLFALAQALAESDPERARALLAEAVQLAATLGYESPNELLGAVFVSAHLADCRPRCAPRPARSTTTPEPARSPSSTSPRSSTGSRAASPSTTQKPLRCSRAASAPSCGQSRPTSPPPSGAATPPPPRTRSRPS